MDIDEIPDRKCARYPERFTILISKEAKTKLNRLKEQNKDVPAILRTIIDNFLSEIESEAS